MGELTGPALRLAALSGDAAFGYTCHGCTRCCRGKSIHVNPYEVARLAEVLGVSTTAVLERDVDPATGALRQQADGACVYLSGGRCTVHSGRPLACRLYPLGWLGGADLFVEVERATTSAGVRTTEGTVRAYLDQQGTAPYEQRTDAYDAVMRRLDASLDTDGPDPGPPPPMRDIDAALAAEPGEIPASVERRTDLHLDLLHRWLDAAGAPPA